MKRIMIISGICLALVLGFCGGSWAQTAGVDKAGGVMELATPETGGGLPLMDALSLRKSERGFSGQAVSDQDLSNILWTAWGYNRPQEKKRTVPTSHNKQEMELYAVLASGVWRYNAGENKLELVLNANVLDRFGGAPLTLLYAGPVKNFLLVSLQQRKFFPTGWNSPRFYGTLPLNPGRKHGRRRQK